MAMYIDLKNINTGETSTKGWHVGEIVPVPLQDEVVYQIQADCGELRHIRDNFPNIPFAVHKPVVYFSAPFAQFIFDNL